MTVSRRAPRYAALALVALLAACGRTDEGPREPAPSRPTAVSAAGAVAAPLDSAAIAAADSARILGSASAPVWMVIVSDFQCPYCKTWHEETYPALRDEYVETGKVRMAYLNFPLSSHRNAWPAAEAAMCAGVQGKFWPMQDAIFQTQEQWSGLPSPEALFDSLATSIGADAAAVRACVNAHTMRPLVQADQQRSEQAGVNSTPSFIIGDNVIAGAYPADRFRAVLDAALSRR
jgi:protein-disulfide isomerase